MPKYKDKVCTICGAVYIPTSPKQKVCSTGECVSEQRRRTERARYRDSRVDYKRVCKVCGVAFVTTDSRRVYCGADECELTRVRVKNRKAEKKRAGTRNEEKRQYYCEVLYPDREVAVGRGSATRLSVEFVKECVEGRGYTLLSNEYSNNSTKLDLVCPEGHEWSVSFHNFKDCENECPTCVSRRIKSKPEEEIYSFVCSIVGEENVVDNTRNVISPYELDIYIPSKKLAIEYCGLYWHSEISGGKERSYHFKKMKACNDKGIRLITIFEDEYLDRPLPVRSRIQNALGVGLRRIYARKCEVKEIKAQQASEFLSRYHLQGKSGARVRWGLFYENELVQVLTIGALSRTHAGSLKGKKEAKLLELKRFASIPGVSVVGGASKLFKRAKAYAEENGFTHIKSYCDMRYGNNVGPVYEKIGFTLLSLTKWTPHYVKGGKRFRNQGLRKTPQERCTGLTEWELRREQGYDRIWDCGHRTYLFEV